MGLSTCFYRLKQEKLTTVLQNGANNIKKMTADANLSSQTKDLSEMQHSKPSVFRENGVLDNETGKKCAHLFTKEMLTKTKHLAADSIHENGEKTNTSSSAEGILPMNTEGSCSQSGVVNCKSPLRSPTFTGSGVTDSSKSKHLQNGVVNNTSSAKTTVLQNGFKDSKRSSSEVEQQSRSQHKSCSGSAENAVVAKKKSSETNGSQNLALLTSEESVSVTRASSGHRSINGIIGFCLFFINTELGFGWTRVQWRYFKGLWTRFVIILRF